jgi:hypothetical protein
MTRGGVEIYVGLVPIDLRWSHGSSRNSSAVLLVAALCSCSSYSSVGLFIAKAQGTVDARGNSARPERDRWPCAHVSYPRALLQDAARRRAPQPPTIADLPSCQE